MFYLTKSQDIEIIWTANATYLWIKPLIAHVHSQNKLIIAFINIFDYSIYRPALVPSYTSWGFCNRLKG